MFKIMLREKYEQKKSEYDLMVKKVEENSRVIVSLNSKLLQSRGEVKRLGDKIQRYEAIFQKIKDIADSTHEQAGQIVGMTSIDYLDGNR